MQEKVIDEVVHQMEQEHESAKSFRLTFVLGFVVLLLSACSAPAATPMPTPTNTATVTPTPSPTPTTAKRATATPTATLACKNAKASVQVSGSSTTVRVGQIVTVTVVATYTGCFLLGLPQYSLDLQADQPQPLFDPGQPHPVEHSTSITPGGDMAQFVLRAVRAGEATVNAVVSYEVHEGFPGAAYWGSSTSTAPLRILVAP
jgi:hypothetical protein